MAVLSRAGCNAGTCHGNFNGKGGFRLSLRGQDPSADYLTLTRGSLGRRINLQKPAAGLILKKPTAKIPHQGGLRFAIGSSEYDILYRWLAAGMPSDVQRAASLTKLDVTPREAFLVQPHDAITIRSRAFFDDGTSKDVSSLSVFETTNPKITVTRSGVVRTTEPGETTIVVRYLQHQATAQLAFIPARPDFVWSKPPAHNFIDKHVFARLKKLRMNPSQLCTDSEFLRRAYLDLLGLLPTPKETRAFLGDKRKDKRAKLVDALLQRPEFADYWALRFSDFLRNEQKSLDRKGIQVYYQWIRDAIAKNVPLNEFARELLSGRGHTYKKPAANYYRALRTPYIRAEATAQALLGIRMQCAKCHNHPFDRWTQNDYHQFAAVFSQVKYKIINNKRKDKLDKHQFIGEQIVSIDKKAEVKHPNTKEVMRPRFLGDDRASTKPDRLLALADWVADPSNPFFARTQANRVWSYLMGRGIVEPNDDFRITNPPTNAALLAALAEDFRKHKFDLKRLVRTIMNSRTYQLSAIPNATNKDDTTNFSRTVVRSLSAEPLLDAVVRVTEVPVEFESYPKGTRATQLPGMPIANRRVKFGEGFRFLRIFGKPERLLSCDCERNESTTLTQALHFVTGSLVNRAVQDTNNRLGRLLKEGKSNAEIIDDLFLAAFCRLPHEAVRGALVKRVEAATNRREALEDVLWAVLSAKEFLLRK